MPVWFLVILVVVLAFAVLLAVAMGYSRRSRSGQSTTIVDRR